MGYPWYSKREGNSGKNGQFKISLEQNCETKEIRYVATLVDHSKRTGRKSLSSTDITELHTKLEKYLTAMETKQDGLLSDITEVFNIYGLTIQSKETLEQIEEVTTSPEERLLNDKEITNIEFLELLDKYGIEINYTLTNWCREKLDKVGYGKWVYRGSFPNKLSDIGYQLFELIEEMATSEKVEEDQEINETTITDNKEQPFNVNKIKEKIIIRGYMGKVEEREGQRVELDDFELYLINFGKYWGIYEKQTGKSIADVKNTKKEALDKLEFTLKGYSDKLKEAITKTIEKDGLITDYKIGTWIRPA